MRSVIVYMWISVEYTLQEIYGMLNVFKIKTIERAFLCRQGNVVKASHLFS